MKNGSREGAKVQRNIEELASIVVDCAFHLHSDLGPGLLETVYEAILTKQLEDKGLKVERQKPVPIRYQPKFPKLYNYVNCSSLK